MFSGMVFSLTRSYNVKHENENRRPDEIVLQSEISKWELYYNKFLVMDNIQIEDDQYDALIETPKSWYNIKAKDGENLPLSGYATYRTTIDTFKKGDTITFKKTATNVSMNVYINRTKVASTGNVSKDLFKNTVPFSYQYYEEYKINNEPSLEIIIEVGYNILGGLNFSPKFTNTNFHNQEDEVISIFYYVVLFIYFSLFVVEIISYFRISDSTVYTANMSGCMFFIAFFSSTTNRVLSSFNFFFSPIAFEILNFAFYALFLLSTTQFFRYTYSKQINKEGVSFGLFIAGLSTLLYAMLIPLRLEIIAYAIYTVIYVGMTIALSYFTTLKNKIDITGNLTKCIFYSIIGLELCVASRTLDIFENTVSIEIISYLIFVFFVFIAIYIAFIVRTYRAAMNEMKYELQNKDLKLLVLKDQIKPHFIFNSLSAIKTLYHEDEEKGDQAVSLLADHLRYNVDVVTSNLIEFSKEIDNVYNYVELKNLRTEKKFNVIFNIDCQDFKVPILSIQPFVENSIKYSKINEKDDGYIEISTNEDENNIYIEIKDNGAGFNPDDIKENSTGIKNVKERYAILLNAEVNIESAINIGTQVKISIPKERKQS